MPKEIADLVIFKRAVPGCLCRTPRKCFFTDLGWERP